LNWTRGYLRIFCRKRILYIHTGLYYQNLHRLLKTFFKDTNPCKYATCSEVYSGYLKVGALDYIVCSDFFRAFWVCVCVGETSGRLRHLVGAFFVPWELPLPRPASLPSSASPPASQSLLALDARAFWLSLRTTLGHFAFARQGRRTTRTSVENRESRKAETAAKSARSQTSAPGKRVACAPCGKYGVKRRKPGEKPAKRIPTMRATTNQNTNL